MQTTKPTPRKLDLQTLILKSGAHSNPEDGVCIMEAVAFVAGEPHSDHPMCASPSISEFLRRWNDRCNEEQRQELKQYIPRLVGSRATPEIEAKRAYLAADFAVRVAAPIALELGGYKDHAAALRALAQVVDKETASAARAAATKASGDAWSR